MGDMAVRLNCIKCEKERNCINKGKSICPISDEYKRMFPHDSPTICMHYCPHIIHEKDKAQQMNDNMKVYIHGKKDISAGYVKARDTVTAIASVIPCKFCKHRCHLEDGRIVWPKIDEIYTDSKCPFNCDDSYYDRLPPDDFYCGYGECTVEV